MTEYFRIKLQEICEIQTYKKEKHACHKNNWYLWQIKLHKHLQPIYFKHAHISQLPDFIAIQQFHSSRAFVEVVAERNTAVPALDFTAARP